MPAFVLDAALAEQLRESFGTPLYVLDEATILANIGEFRVALSSLKNPTRISFASKANSTVAIIQIAASQGCHIDVASLGELAAAQMARLRPQSCTYHGNNRSFSELKVALEQGIGEIVLDCLEDIEAVARIGQGETMLSLRINPFLETGLDPKVDTGSSVSKFGFTLQDGQALEAYARGDELKLKITGLHLHLGSQIFDSNLHAEGLRKLIEFCEECELPLAQCSLSRQSPPPFGNGGGGEPNTASTLADAQSYPEPSPPAPSPFSGTDIQKSERGSTAWQLLNIGGGYGVTYTDEEPLDLIEVFANIAKQTIPKEITLGIEPGRALVANAGLTLYTVGAIKDVAGVRMVAVDGGLADNPRPALYGAKYRVSRPGQVSAGQRVKIVGRHCENDVLIEDADLPSDLAAGDLLQVLCTGAYNSSMASNYNRYPRPATVLIRKDGPILVQVREDVVELLAREIPIGL